MCSHAARSTAGLDALGARVNAATLPRVRGRQVDRSALPDDPADRVGVALRLARALTILGIRAGIRNHLGVEIRIKNEQLASLADVSPFTASRLLKRWEREGMITKRRGLIHITCPEKLLFD